MRAKQKFKKGTFSRRVFSILMALAMVITLMPMNAMEVKAEDATKKITFMNLNVIFSKIPSLTVGESAPDFVEEAVTASGTGVSGIEECGWVVQANAEHVTSEYISWEEYRDSEQNDHWIPLRRQQLTILRQSF